MRNTLRGGFIGLSLLGLGACTEPLFIPQLSTPDVHQLRDGGYCRDAWGRPLGDQACSQKHEDLARESLKSRTR